MEKNISRKICQGEIFSHAQCYFAIVDSRGIAISMTIALTLFIIFICYLQHKLNTYQCLRVLKMELLQICKTFEY